MPGRLSEGEVARRLPVWTALSVVFLDTELDADDYPRIADVANENGFSARETEAMFRDQVAPAFVWNLWSVAGEWQGWPAQFVRERVLSVRGKRLARAVAQLMNRDLLDREWARIAATLPDEG